MKYILYFLFIIGALLVFIAMTNVVNQTAPNIPAANDGIIDLSEMDDLENSVVHLDGTWDFYWETFTHSLENNKVDLGKGTKILVPSSWVANSSNDEQFPNTGYGTYRLRVFIPEKDVGKMFGLYIPGVATAYKLWINNEFLLSNGTIATNKEEMIPVNYSRTVYFKANSATIDVAIEVANYSQRKAGLWESIRLGSGNEIALLKEKNIALQLLVVGSLVIMGIYNIFIYLLRRRLIYSMFLGILCLLFGMRTLVTGETFFLHVFPTFPWELQVKLEYLPIVIGLPLFVKYVNGLYEGDKLIFFEKFVIVLSIIFTAIVLALPAIVYTQLLVVFLIVVPMTLVYFGYIFLNAFFDKRAASLFTLIAFTIFIVTAMNDSLYFLDLTKNGGYVSSGFLVFILSQTFAHAIQYSEANYQVEKLSHDLMVVNHSLEKKVEERTQELSHLYSKLRKSENERKHLMSDLAHEISKPLTLIKGYSEAMVDNKLLPEKDFLQIIHDNANISERLIHDLSELSKLEMRQMKMIFQKVMVKDYPNHILKHHRWTVENKEKNFIWLNRNVWLDRIPEEAYIYIDSDRLNQVLINIIENALHHLQSGENIFLEAVWRPFKSKFPVDGDIVIMKDGESFEGERIGESIIKIIDEGEGIKQEEIPFVFNRMYRGTNHKMMDSRGLGLAICKEIVEIHGGKIWLESNLGQGSTFYISLPTFYSIKNDVATTRKMGRV